MLEENPSISRNGAQGGSLDNIEQVKQWIKESCLPKSNSDEHDEYYGYGLLQVNLLVNKST